MNIEHLENSELREMAKIVKDFLHCLSKTKFIINAI